MKVVALGFDVYNRLDVTVYENIRVIDIDNPYWLSGMYLLPDEIIAIPDGENASVVEKFLLEKFENAQFLLV